ncbi:signal peptidase II [Acidisphaera sp. L21]|uniref:signal peptidase II n=1 Tax=Acidisphaera sp. L21 TaxID=1641851 RepID=UPI0015769BBD|nr:signal peptidase II [Acidisphaera sp. L21]
MTLRNRLTALGLVALVLVFVADQGSKTWILQGLQLPLLGRVDLLPVLSLTMVWNQGVTFGLFKADGAWGPLLLVAVAIAIVVALAVWLRRAESRLVAFSLGAIAGGAIGNVLDRLRFGAVVDFIHFHVGSWSWYVFNVADAAIVCGVAALVLDGLRPKSRGADERLAGPGPAEL